MEEALKNIIIKFDIDIKDDLNRHILFTAYEDQKGVSEHFLRSLGISIEPMDVRVYKKYKKRLKHIKWQKCTMYL